MNAEIRFFHPHAGRFLDPGAVALRQMFPKDAVKRTVDEDHLPLARPVVRDGRFVLEGDGSRAVGRVGR